MSSCESVSERREYKQNGEPTVNARIEVDAGVCGYRSIILARSEDDQNVSFTITSGCEKIRSLADRLQAHNPVDAYREIDPNGESVVLTTVRQCLKSCCAGCAVPSGIFKGMQVAAGLALPKDISIRIVTE